MNSDEIKNKQLNMTIEQFATVNLESYIQGFDDALSILTLSKNKINREEMITRFYTRYFELSKTEND